MLMDCINKKKMKVKKSFLFRKKKKNRIHSLMSFNKIKRKSLSLILKGVKMNNNVKVFIIYQNNLINKIRINKQ